LQHQWTGGTRFGGVTLAVIGAVVLLGWLTGARALTAVGHGYMPMAPNTAALFLLLGASLFALTVPMHRARLLARCAIALTFVMAGAHLAEYVAGAELGVDRWLFSVAGESVGLAPVGKMAFFTALAFFLACVALFVQSFPGRLRFAGDLAGALALLVTLIGLVFSLGYLYHAPLLYGGSRIPMALPSSVAFVVLGLSIAVPHALRGQAEQRERDRDRAHRDLTRQVLVFETIGDAVIVMDLAGHIIDWNPAASRLFGYTKAEVIGRPVETVHDPALLGQLEATIQKSLRRDHRWAGELPFQRKDGSRGVADVVVVAQLDQKGEPIAWIGVNRDVTERHLADGALADSRALLATAEELAHVGSWALDVQTGELTWSDEVYRIFGYEPGTSAVSREWFLEQVHPDDRAAVSGSFQRLVEDGYTAPVECRVIRPDGFMRTIQARGRLQRDDSRGFTRALGSVQDVTDRVEAERALRRAHATVAALLDAAPLAIIALDAESRITMWNPAAERLFGWAANEVIGRPPPVVSDEHIPEYMQLRDTVLAGGSVTGFETRRRRKDGSLVDVLLSAAPLQDGTGSVSGVVVLQVDVTERKGLEEQLRQSQRLEAIGQLAGGIAHDFNNLLTVVISYAAILLEDLDPEDAKLMDVREIAKAAERAAALTQQLLAFGRRQFLQPSVLDVNDTVREMENMLRRLVTADIALVTVLDPGLRAVRADPGQLEQVLMNLVVNARDAMPEGGRLTVETANVEIDAAYVGPHATAVRPGAYVRLVVSDTGSGMDDATQARMFEPFFTTKEPGKGTGLGLSTVYGIVKQSGGHVWCYSELGRGTTFKIYLPQADAPDAPAERADDGVVRAPVRRGVESVLIVEDDEAVRSVARRILATHGYAVLEAENGAKALRLCDETTTPIDLVIADMVMPEMNGSELARHLRDRHPAIRVLFMSGYTGNAALKHGFLEPGATFIEKPFAPEALVAKVREMLDDSAPENLSIGSN
jgi:two-component system cell cycle sensor histidine kinase/response regulator CckA